MKCPGVSDCVATVRHDNVFAIAAGLRWSAAVPPLHKGDAVTKLLVGAIAGGMLACAAILGDGIASADTALIVPGTAPSPYGPLRSLYHFNPAMQPQIGANYYNPPLPATSFHIRQLLACHRLEFAHRRQFCQCRDEQSRCGDPQH